jgi:hypothetical protein
VTVALREQRSVPPPGAAGVAVRREVWQSLLSMLRVYAYAASLRHGEIAVIESAPQTALLEHQGRILALSFDLNSGKGSWQLPGAKKTSGSFEILDDGRLHRAGVEKQLDEAAIDWVEELTHAAAQEEAD